MERRTGEGLEAEEPTEPTSDEITEWVAIYTKLIDFTDDMLRRTRTEHGEHKAPGRRHLETTNIRIMEEELEVFERRRSFLQRRRRRLQVPE